jgi:outer membrane protein assembly factor BamB
VYTSASGQLVASDNNGPFAQLQALDPRSGATTWQASCGGDCFEGPVADSGDVFVEDQSHVQALAGKTGHPLWSQASGGDFTFGLAAGAGTVVALASPGIGAPATLTAWKEGDGSALYQVPVPGAANAAALDPITGAVYVLANEARGSALYSYDLTTGNVRWHYDEPAEALSDQPVVARAAGPTVAGGYVVFLAGDVVRAIDAKTGTLSASYGVGLPAPMAAIAAGVVGGRLAIAVRTASDQAPTPSDKLGPAEAPPENLTLLTAGAPHSNPVTVAGTVDPGSWALADTTVVVAGQPVTLDEAGHFNIVVDLPGLITVEAMTPFVSQGDPHFGMTQGYAVAVVQQEAGKNLYEIDLALAARHQ